MSSGTAYHNSQQSIINASLNEDELRHGCRLGLDSHADVSCVGKHARISEIFHGKLCQVQPFNDSYQPMKNIQTVNANFAYDTPDGNTYILEVNQALDFTSTMEHSLLCTNQSRIHGVVVDDVPKSLDPYNRSTHSIYFPDKEIRCPLLMHGPVSFLPVRYPTDEEMDFCPRLELTSVEDWNPQCFDDLEGRNVSSVTKHKLHSPDLSTMLQRNVHIVNAIKHKSSRDVTPVMLSNLWNISLEAADRTLKSTTQDYVRTMTGKMSRRYKTRAHQRQYKQLGGYMSAFCSDTFFSSVTSTRGNNCIQMFANRGNYQVAYPLSSKSKAHEALDRFLHDVGIPSELLTDGASELTLSKWGEACRRHKIHTKTTEPHSPWQNHSELTGGIIKRSIAHMMRRTCTPLRLWDYCWEYYCAIRSLTATGHIQSDGGTPFQVIHGYSPDISEYLSFSWFQWVWYHNPDSPDKASLGRWLGPAHSVGQGLAYHVLTNKGKVIIRSTVNPIAENEIADEDVKRRMKDYTETMESYIGNYASATAKHFTEDVDAATPYNTLFGNHIDIEEDIEFQELDENGHIVERFNIDDLPKHDNPLKESDDKYIGMKVPLRHHSGELREGTIVSRKRNADGSLVGTEHSNPIVDTRVYEVEFPDGSIDEFATNLIVENLYSHIDDEGNSHSILKSIIDHQTNKDVAIPKSKGYFTSATGCKRRVVTTKGWKLKVQWLDGTQSWIPLKDIKDANPIEVAEYAIARSIQDEPAFAWWVPHVLRKRNRIIKQVTHRVRKNMRFGVPIPKDVKEALQFDADNGNTLWHDSIEKELKNVRVAFELLREGENPPPGYKPIPYHIILDVKFDLTRKARLVAGGHRHRDVPSYDTYSSVVSRDSVRILFTIAALNELDIKAADIGNAYLNAKNKEKVYVICGEELFGPSNKGKKAIVARALYGLRSAGNAWRHHFSSYILDELGFVSTKADPDVYRKPFSKSTGEKYYAYIIVYVDDILVVHEDPNSIMNRVNNDFRLKNGIEDPKMYLGTDVRKWSYQDDSGDSNHCWALGSESYLKEAVRICENLMKVHSLDYSSRSKKARNTPFSNQQYRPELDTTPFCDPDLHTIYQNLVGILRWLCELGRIDIVHEVSLLSQYLAQPRIGHLQQLLNIFCYLKYHSRSWMPLDPTGFDVLWTPKTESEQHPVDRAAAMKDLYPDVIDELPYDMPEPRGRAIDINIFVDADHAGNRVTRRSHTGIILFLNMSPILWFSKKQNTVETSTFGSEFIALRISVELLDSLLYKLRMFGIPINGPARIFCDNESVVTSSSVPESRLKKKHCSIAYHRVRETIAAGKSLIYYESSITNIADLLTKPLSASVRDRLIGSILA